jgi:hypothetical protein
VYGIYHGITLELELDVDDELELTELDELEDEIELLELEDDE